MAEVNRSEASVMESIRQFDLSKKGRERYLSYFSEAVISPEPVDIFVDRVMKSLYMMTQKGENSRLLGISRIPFCKFRISWFYKNAFLGDRLFFYIMKDGDVVGYYKFWKEQNIEGYEGEWFWAVLLDEKYRGTGLSRRTFHKLMENKLSLEPMDYFYATVKEINKPALKYMKEMGFVEVERRVKRYSEYPEKMDRVFLIKKLED